MKRLDPLAGKTGATKPPKPPVCPAEEHDDTNAECTCSRSLRIGPLSGMDAAISDLSAALNALGSPEETPAGMVPVNQTAPDPPHITEMMRLTAKKKAADKAMRALRHFIGSRQRAAILCGMRGEEGEWFMDRMIALAALIAGMPVTYGQDGLGENAVVSLHYFAGGAANWWITERDKGSPDDGKDGHPANTQQQAFGLANLSGGPNDPDAELGYISIAEIIAHHGEIDLHFEPRTLRELKDEQRRDEAAPKPMFSIGDVLESPDASGKIVPFKLPDAPSDTAADRFLTEMQQLTMPE
jgi:hypothetical protein